MIEGRVSRINKKLAEHWKIELAELPTLALLLLLAHNNFLEREGNQN